MYGSGKVTRYYILVTHVSLANKSFSFVALFRVQAWTPVVERRGKLRSYARETE